MWKLLHLKLLSKTLQNPRPLAQKTPTRLFSSSSSTSSSSFPQSHSISGLFLDSFCSWRSQNQPPLSLWGLLTCPTPLKQVVSNTHFLMSLKKRLSDHGVGLLKFSSQSLGRAFHGFDTRRRSFWRSLMPTSDEVVYGLIGANIAVFLLWRMADPIFMKKHFTISVANIKAGRLHTLITNAFSHQDMDHIFTNMIGLYFFGTNIGRLFGPEFLLKLYIAGAISGSIFFLVHEGLIVPYLKGSRMADHSRIYALGASAAVNSIVLLDVFLFPKNIYYLNFIIPVPAALMGAILIGSDLWRVKKGDGNISGSAHLGGALVAALVWARLKKRWI